MRSAIANGADDGLVWLRLAQSELAANDDHAMASAYNAYLKSTDPVERGSALFVIGRDYDRHDKQKEALAAFDAGLAFTRLTAIAERAEELRRLVAFRVTKVDVQAEADAARACLRFNEQIATKGDISYSAFVRSEPKLDGIVTARGDTLCLDGMKHGTIYNVEILSGLPASTGEQMREKFTTRIVVPDRKPQIRFSGTGYVLPRQDTSGLPRDHDQSRQGQIAAIAGQRAQPRPEHRRRAADDELFALRGRRDRQPHRQPRLARRDGDIGRAQSRGDDGDPAQGHAAGEGPRHLPRGRRAQRLAAG